MPELAATYKHLTCLCSDFQVCEHTKTGEQIYRDRHIFISTISVCWGQRNKH